MNDERDENKSTSDLGSWLISMGAPLSITELMPSEITGLDVAPIVSMLGGVGIRSGLRQADTAQTAVDEIRWLHIID
jgi:hypothetical protein